jgi:hypothetical protein
MSFWLSALLYAAILSYAASVVVRGWRSYRFAGVQREFYAMWSLLSPTDRQLACSRAYGVDGCLQLSLDQCDDLITAAIDLARESQRLAGTYDITSFREGVFSVLPVEFDLAG